MFEARYYEKLENKKCRCLLCPKECVINNKKVGFCRGRINDNGILYSKIYQQCSSIAMDPIEKKPLYHFYPSQMILSLGTVGCNFGCKFCQNWQISQSTVSTQEVSPSDLIKYVHAHHSIGIAYTYNEPLIWYEYVLETAKLIKEENLKNVLVTNGFINEVPLLELLPFIDALNIDIKSFKNEFYEGFCNGKLAPVLKTAKHARAYAHVEITNLLIPGLNDSDEEISHLVDWIASELGDETPLHFSRYFPHYKMTIESTPTQTLNRAREIGMSRLKYVYMGNLLTKEGENTFCPNCKATIILREGYTIHKYHIKDSKCTFCGFLIHGVWGGIVN